MIYIALMMLIIMALFCFDIGLFMEYLYLKMGWQAILYLNQFFGTNMAHIDTIGHNKLHGKKPTLGT
jgi:hypothetical protein